MENKKRRDLLNKNLLLKIKGAVWEASVRDVGPGLDIKTINETKLTYHFNDISNWCVVDFYIEKNIESELGTI